jgi:type II secretory pathway component PulJ
MMGFRARPPFQREAGATLVEVLVAAVLLSVVSALCVSAITSAARSEVRIDDETQGLQDVQTVAERLSRDLRQARGVDSAANGLQLTIWVDANSDFVQTPDETITWCLRSGPGCLVGAATGGHYDVVRFTAAAPAVQQVVGRTVVNQLAFTYNATPVQNANQVSVDLTYDAIVNAAASPRHLVFQVRMRNVS